MIRNKLSISWRDWHLPLRLVSPLGIVATMDVLEKLLIVAARSIVVSKLLLLAIFELISYRSLDLRYILKLGLILPENVVFFPDNLGSVNVVPLQSTQESLVQFGPMDRLVSR